MAHRATRSVSKRKRLESSDQVVKSPSVAKPRKTPRTGSLSDKNDTKTKQPKSNGSEDRNQTDRNSNSNGRSVVGRQDELIEDVVSALFSKKKTTCSLRGFNPVAPHSGNFLHYMHQLQAGCRAAPKLRQCLSGAVVSRLSELQLYRTASPFERRCTAVEWHPTRPGVVAIGSKGGEILIWDINTVNKDILIPGTGPAGSIQALKFQPHDHSQVMTSSIDGTVSVHNLETSQKEVFMDTLNSHDDWYCSLDFHHRTNVATVGDNHGNVTLKSLDGKTVFAGRLHRQKVTHVEYSPREEWLLATASVDQTVQLWDIRMLEGRSSALAVLKHDKPVNSAYFSLASGSSILTTDQNSQMRVYGAVTFDLAVTIPHPHRQFQHLTPIKACWHPLCDLVVVGRYPDEKFPGYTAGELRTIDMFDAETGRLVHQLHDPQAKGIVSLNKFSHNGEYLASTMGMNILLWSPRHDIEEKHRGLMTSLTETGLVTGKATSRRPTPRPRQTKAKKEEEKTSQAKLKAKVTTKTKKR